MACRKVPTAGWHDSRTTVSPHLPLQKLAELSREEEAQLARHRKGLAVEAQKLPGTGGGWEGGNAEKWASSRKQGLPLDNWGGGLSLSTALCPPPHRTTYVASLVEGGVRNWLGRKTAFVAERSPARRTSPGLW